MCGGLESRCVGPVYGVDGARPALPFIKGGKSGQNVVRLRTT